MSAAQARRLTMTPNRPGDAIGAGLCDPQELHLCAGAADGGGHAQGGQGAQVLGLEYRQTQPAMTMTLVEGAADCTVGRRREGMDSRGGSLDGRRRRSVRLCIRCHL